MILILSNKDDLAADYVITRLLERNLPYFRINAEDITESDYDVEISTTGSKFNIVIEGKTLFFEDISCVWFRRQIYPTVNNKISKGQQSFAIGELIHLIEGILPNNCRWIDEPERVRFAERKLQQLKLAKQLNIPIPRTIISNDSRILYDFASSFETGVVCKPIFRGLHKNYNETYSAYTRKIDPVEFKKERGIKVFPTLLQELIPKGKDLRITVIGQHLFGVEIITKDKQIDWRLPNIDVDYQKISIQPDVASTCKNILYQLGLTCGAFDFAISPEGEMFFLEVNPVGEWAWLDIKFDFGIRDVLIDHLMGRQ